MDNLLHTAVLTLSIFLLTALHVQSASIALNTVEALTHHRLKRTVTASSAPRVSASDILSRLFRDYQTIITGHLLHTSLAARSSLQPTSSSSQVVTGSQHMKVGSAGARPLHMKMIPPGFSSLSLLNQVSPRVEVRVRGEEQVVAQQMITVALVPDMSTYDAINAAKVLYSYQNNNERELINPFSIEMDVLRERRCAIIQQVAGEAGTWRVVVRDFRKQVLHDDICIPRRRELTMRPGYSILLKKEAADGDQITSENLNT